MLMERITKKSAGAVLCVVNGTDVEVLLLLQSNERYGREGKPVIDIGPKGNIEENEDERTAALREVNEETGLTPMLDDKFRELTKYEFEDISRESGKLAKIKKSVVYFLAYIKQEDVARVKLSGEHMGCKLVRIDEALREVRHESQRRVLRVVQRYISGADR